MGKTLGIDSCYDDATYILYRYRNEKLYPALLAKGIQLVLRKDQDAIRSKVKEVAIDPEVKFITGSGHGSDSAFKGHLGCNIYKNRCPLLGKAYDKEEVEDKIIHFQACYTANSLGPDLIEKGCKAFFGYVGVYSVVIPYEDTFCRCDAEIDYAITDGVDADEAYRRTVIWYNEAISSLSSDGRFSALGYLEKNLEFLRCLTP